MYYFVDMYDNKLNFLENISNSFRNGNDATREDMATGDVIVNAYTIDWSMIYELSNMVTTVNLTNDIMLESKNSQFGEI